MTTHNDSRHTNWIRRGLPLIAMTLLLSAKTIHATETVQVEASPSSPVVIRIEVQQPTQNAQPAAAIAQVQAQQPAMVQTQQSYLADQTTDASNNTYANMKVKSPFDPICRRAEFNVEFLYWKADEDGLEYGTKMQASPIIGAASKTNTKLLDLDFDWDPGFRLGLGVIFNHFDCWELNLNWTRIHNHASGHTSAKGIESQVGDVDTIISPWVNLLFELRAGASHAKAHWKVDYNTLDLDFGKSLNLSRRFTMTPHFGLRGAIINQHYRATYDSVFLLAESAPLFHRDVKFKAKNEFSGIGLRGGTELMCLLSKNWHIFSEFNANVLYGKFQVRMKNNNDQGLGQGSVPPMPIDFLAREHFWRIRLNLEEAIGLGYDAFFNKDRYRLRFRAGYEMTQWINQNELFYSLYFRGTDTISSVPIRNQGDLSFQGLRLSAQFDF